MNRLSALQFFLAILVSLLLVEDSNAQPTVLYCKEKGVVSVDRDDEKMFKKERFKLSVTPSGIKFGSDFGFLPNVSIPFTGSKRVSVYSGPDNWWVASKTDHIAYRDGFLLVLQSYLDRAIAVSAQCDVF